MCWTYLRFSQRVWTIALRKTVARRPVPFNHVPTAIRGEELWKRDSQNLSENTLDIFRLDPPGQLLVQAAVKIGEFPIVQSHQVKDGGVEVANVMLVHRSFV